MRDFYVQLCFTFVIVSCALLSLVVGNPTIGTYIFYGIGITISVTLDYLTYKRCKRN